MGRDPSASQVVAFQTSLSTACQISYKAWLLLGHGVSRLMEVSGVDVDLHGVED